MGKYANMLKMLIILNNRDYVQYKELEDELEMSNKQIRNYRVQLEMNGYYIENKSGPYGGIRLMDKNLLLPLYKNLTPEQQTIINLIGSKTNISLQEMFHQLVKQLELSNPYHEYLSQSSIETITLLNKAIEKKLTIQIVYEKTVKVVPTMTVDPYELFTKYFKTYVLIYNHYNQKIVPLDITKIKSIHYTENTFTHNPQYKNQLQRYNDSAGVYLNNNVDTVELQVSTSLLPYVKKTLEANIEMINEINDYVHIAFTANNLFELKRRILSFGSSCKVLSPASLKEMIVKELELMNNVYQDDTSESINDLYHQFDQTVKQSLSRYLSYQYPNHKTHPYHNYILDTSYPFEEALLPENRELFKTYIPSTVELHSPNNLKSSQLLTFDFFLPYINKEYLLSSTLKLDEKVESIQFETVFPDYSHVDVYCKTKDNKKVLIEVKYAESSFSRNHEIKSIHEKKYNGYNTKNGIVEYKSINTMMDGIPVSIDEFYDNHQLFRTLYNTFNDVDGEPGYMIVIYPKANQVLDIQYNQFLFQLKHIHQFQYCDRVIRLYWEDIAILHEHFTEKYLVLSSKRLNVCIQSKEEWDSSPFRNSSLITVDSLESFTNAFPSYDTYVIEVQEELSDLELANALLETFDDSYHITNCHKNTYSSYSENYNIIIVHQGTHK
ncbi:helix-turn-helix transcriptional regulator [Candidatus Xianfuyuplasma coldseepsis]|uniref:WYL domain-containing transcriptional regulator n=1 Tax=Candidatus Xianfuyuplasma coldseepsis TaxID=2782163 RepID=A0A7L7KQM0_9MOLU|nr:WYL domain-containing transcriptional regulator [Xianfuyuplasma coldseepsis]QMS85101.1 WYL domain-containing transcriptional regulator [Xianfuyuplasma coldseepsis]